jgi:ATP-dependent Clp protease adaptor protein ClpS
MAEPRSNRPETRPQRGPEQPQPAAQSRRYPRYAVVLHRDRSNGFDFVVEALRKVFRYGRLRAFWLALKAHLRGQCAVWSGPLEVAELKADQLRGCGADPRARRHGAAPLHVSVEMLRGE